MSYDEHYIGSVTALGEDPGRGGVSEKRGQLRLAPFFSGSRRRVRLRTHAYSIFATSRERCASAPYVI